jgi:hypothetical protein
VGDEVQIGLEGGVDADLEGKSSSRAIMLIVTNIFAQYDEEKEEYTHILKIKHNEAFKLMPVSLHISDSPVCN